MAEGGTPNDASVLRQAIQIGTRGISQILKVYQAGTDEIRQLLTQECEVIFECKVCRSLFRGLPNLIAHKRAYCIKEYVEQRKEFPNFYSSDIVTVMPDAPQGKSQSELSRLLVEPTGTAAKAEKSISKTNLVPILSPSGKSTWLKPKNRDDKSSSQATKTGKSTEGDKEELDDENDEGDENYANVLKIVPARDKETMACSSCNKKFTTMKSLVRHYNHLHLGEQTLYRCCLCPSVFTYQRSCRRHLERKHQKDTAEVAKLWKMILRKATKVTRKVDLSNISPHKEDKTTAKFSNSGVIEVAGAEAKSNSNPVESAALITKVVQTPVTTQANEAEDFDTVKERLTCPDCGKEFEKRSILDRHMKVCADYAKIAVTFDMSLVKGMQHLATYSGHGQDKSDSDDSKTSPGKKNRRKAAPTRLSSIMIDSDVESDARSVTSDKSSRFDGSDAMPKLQPIAPLKSEHTETVSRPSGRKMSKPDESLAKQTKLSNIETVLQFLKNPKKRSLMTIVGSEAASAADTEKDDYPPPKLEREDWPVTKRSGDERQRNSLSDAIQTLSEDEAKVTNPIKKESHLVESIQADSLFQRNRTVSETRATRTTSRKSWDSAPVGENNNKASPRAILKSNCMASDTGTVDPTRHDIKSSAKNAITESKEYQEPKFEVIDLDKHRPERAARKRERSEERSASPAKRREIITIEQHEPGKVNRRAPRYASNFTTRRRQSMLEDILSGVGEGEEEEEEEEDDESNTADQQRRNSEPSSDYPQQRFDTVSSGHSGVSRVAPSPAASPAARVLKHGDEKMSPKKNGSKAGEKSNEGASNEVDCDEAGVLRCMLMDADAAPKGRRKGALLPSHIAQHVNYEEKVCNICSKDFNSISELISHISKTHMNMKRYRCSLCSVEGMYFSEITRHIARTHRRAFRANHKLEWLSMCVKPINVSSE